MDICGLLMASLFLEKKTYIQNFKFCIIFFVDYFFLAAIKFLRWLERKKMEKKIDRFMSISIDFFFL